MGLAVLWGTFHRAEPDLAAFAAQRLHDRVAYLATLRPDGAPRVHPVTPIIAEGHLFLFMKPASPKGRDLRRDGRYALHCGVEDQRGGEGELYLNGRGTLVEDNSLRNVASAGAPYAPGHDFVLFELLLEQVSSLRYEDGKIGKREWKSSS